MKRSKFKVGDSVCFADSLHGEVLHGKVEEIEARNGKTFYFVSYKTDGLGVFYRKPEAQLFDKDREARADWCKSEIKLHERKIRELKKELKECLSK